MAKLIASAGPFQGVRTISDMPYTDASKFLYIAYNGYLRDASSPSIWLSRPGMANPNSGAQIGSGQRTQGSHAHVDPTTGTIYRFFVVNGHLYRSNTTFTAFTDVTPVGITIDTATYRVSFASVGSSLVVTDGVNRPWVASNFAATPITGAYIDIDGAGGSWSSWGKPTIYQDSVMWITQTVPGGSAISPRVGIVWSEPNQPATGYTQSGYANFWNLIETGSDPLYAILGTNNGLFYWRQSSIGVATGTPSVNFSTTATRDARGTPIGSVSPWAITQFQDNIFFLDVFARPWMMPINGQPEPIWQQLTGGAAWNTTLTISDVSRLCVGSVVPQLNQVALALGSNNSTESPYQFSVFDGQTGAYSGEWAVAGVLTAFGPVGIGVDTMLVQRDSLGSEFFCVCGGKTSDTSGGYVWKMSALSANAWTDDNGTIFSYIETGTLAYSADYSLYPDTATAIVRSSSDITVTLYTEYSFGGTSLTVSPITGAATPVQQYRATFGLDGLATRFITFKIAAPQSPGANQWGIQRIEVFGAASLAGPTDA